MFPELKEWKELLNAELETVGNKREDLNKIISRCDEYSNEIQKALGWVSNNRDFVGLIKQQYVQLREIRFPKEQIELGQPSANKLTLLTNSKERKAKVREVSLEIANPGIRISALEINSALEKKGFAIDAPNPNAVASTIMWGYQEEFVKVEGERGVFERKQAT